MNIIIRNVFLPFVGGGDVGFGVFDEITPADAADVGMFTAPDGGAEITEAFVLRLAVKYVVPHNGEDHMVMIDCATFIAAGASLQIIVV